MIDTISSAAKRAASSDSVVFLLTSFPALEMNLRTRVFEGVLVVLAFILGVVSVGRVCSLRSYGVRFRRVTRFMQNFQSARAQNNCNGLSESGNTCQQGKF